MRYSFAKSGQSRLARKGKSVRGESRTKSIAVAGIGAIRRRVIEALDDGIVGWKLTAVSAKDLDKAKSYARRLIRSRWLLRLKSSKPLADVVVECAPAHLVPEIISPFLRAGKTAIVLSASALLLHSDLIDVAHDHGGQIIAPTGAIVGLDAVTAAAEGTIHAVRMITRKPVQGLEGAPYLFEHDICISDLTEPLQIFRGSPREAAIGFPANVNVSVALALAGIGADLTVLEIWADPSINRNSHRIEVESTRAISQ